MADQEIHDHAEENAYGGSSSSEDEWDAPVRQQTAEEAAADEARRQKRLEQQQQQQQTGPELPANMAAEEKELRGEDVSVTFHLPSGDTINADFFMGQTVEAMKMYLELQRPGELAYDKTSLFLGERALMDPLSLNDLPFKPNEKNDVKVVVA